MTLGRAELIEGLRQRSIAQQSLCKCLDHTSTFELVPLSPTFMSNSASRFCWNSLAFSSTSTCSETNSMLRWGMWLNEKCSYEELLNNFRTAGEN